MADKKEPEQISKHFLEDFERLTPLNFDTIILKPHCNGLHK